MSTTALKLLALVLMLIDHIGEFIPGAPLWLRWIGRLSAPIFFFCAAQGLSHTHDRRKYLLRLYAFGVLFGAAVLACNNLVQEPYNYINNNIFVTIFAFCAVVSLFELWTRDKKKGTILICAFILVQLLAIAVAPATMRLPLKGATAFVGAVLGSIALCEGGLIFVLLGVMLYWARDDKRKLALTYIVFSAYILGDTMAYAGWNINVLLHQDFQWMMVLALPFMLLYNGKRGAGLKYLFYIFYPLHIIALFFLGTYMA